MATKYLTAELHKDIEKNKEKISAITAHQGVQDERIRENRTDIDRVCEKAGALELAVVKIVASNESTNKVAKWAIGIVTAIIITFFSALVTGKLSVLVR